MNNYKATKITIGDDTYELEGTKDYNELENKPDLTIYAEKENTYTKDEVNTIIRETETTLELAIEEKVDTTTYNDKIGEIEAVLEGKANKSDIPSMDDYVDKDSYNVKMEAVDNAIATKADTETVNSRFGSVDEYLDVLRTEVEGKADVSSLEYYVTKGEYEVKVEAIDNAIATKADAEETANRFGSVDDYLEQLHTEIEGKADQGDTYTKEEVDHLIAGAGAGVTKEYVDGEISRVEGEIPSLEGYATEEWVEGKGYLTEHQSLDNYYTKEETDTAIQGVKETLQGEINTKVDTTTYEGKISEIEEVLEGKADRTEIPSLAGYATESYVSDAVDTTKQGLQSDIDQKLNKDEYDAKMQSIDTSLAGKVEHNEFVERCEAIEQSYLPLSGGNLTGNLTLGSITETAYKKFEAIRNTSGETNGAALYVNSDGTAAFYHKSYNGSSATNDAILKFDTNGLQYAKSGSRTTTATVFKNVLVDGDLQTETWTFELEDGSIITKEIYLK